MLNLLILLGIAVILGVVAHTFALLAHFLMGFNDGDTLDEEALFYRVGASVVHNYNNTMISRETNVFKLFVNLFCKAILCRLCLSGHVGTVLGIIGIFTFGFPWYLFIIICSVGFTTAYINS